MSEIKSKRQLFDSRLKEQKDFWVKKLSHEVGFSGLRLDHDRPGTFLGDKDHIELPLAAETQQKLLRLTGSSPILIYSTLMAVLKVCLYKYNGSTSIVVGSPSRNDDESDPNLLPIVDELAGDESFLKFLFRVRENLDLCYAHEHYPYDRLLGDLGREKQDDKCELFDIALVLKGFHTEMPEAKNDITLSFVNEGERVVGEIQYNSSLFEKRTVERFGSHFINVMEAALADHNITIAEMSLLTREEQRQLIFQWNDTLSVYPRDRCIHEIFEHYALARPDAPAILSDTGSLSYAQLNTRANQLAHYLRTLGVQAEVPVAICIERTPELLVALLAILKAGGVYVPLDPASPVARLAIILGDVDARLILTERKFSDVPPRAGAQFIHVDDEQQTIARQSEANLPVTTTALNLAYIMYTSGSTGAPKGVGVTHRGVVRLVKDTGYVSLSSEEVFLHFAPLSFDASTFEIWGGLLNGARLALAPAQRAMSLAELAAVIARQGVTTLWLTAGLFHQMVDEGMSELRGVRQLLAGGDVLSATHVRQALEQWPATRVINGYGPTETTTFACSEAMSHSAEVGERVLIGRPIANTKVYILDEQMRAAPVGVRGEIYIGGDGLARGYVGRAGQTAERFVPDPYSAVPGERLYATGDIGSYCEDGRIEFVGRRDGQVKVRGFRIETGEIEAVLNQYPGVREVVVIARANGANDKDLVAYVVTDNGNFTYDELQDFLAQRLPVYMAPARFVTLEKLPLTPNGKIDRAALPAPEKMRPALQEEFIAPKTPVEKLIAEIWCEVLDIDQVGLNDDFFKLGGHSLLATKVATRLREAFQEEISLGKMFEAPTVAEIAAAIEERQARPKSINDFEIERLPRGNADMAQVLAELANLSEHEAQSLLMTEPQAKSAAK